MGSNLENLTLTGSNAITGTGNALNNVIYGGAASNRENISDPEDPSVFYGLGGGDDNDKIYGEAGDDNLDGGAGNDTLVGGTGNDRYAADSNDTIIEKQNEGNFDSVSVYADNYVLPNNVENLNFGGNVSIGNALGNRIITFGGSSDITSVYGAEGDDSLSSYFNDYSQLESYSNDRFFCEAGNDLLFSRDGTDYLEGGSGNDYLIARGSGYSTADDTLNGGIGNDFLDGDGFLDGGSGDDTLRGYGILNGSDGNDRVNGSGTLNGGDGDDTLSGDFDSSEKTHRRYWCG